MNIRDVEKTIRSCLGGAFTGKIAVRIANGEIIACDVGEVGTGMPYLDRTEAMARVVNMPAPVSKPPDVVEAEAAADAARASWERAKDSWLDAVDALRKSERAAPAAAQPSPTTGLPTLGYDGRPFTPELSEARARVHSARAAMDQLSEELTAATVNAMDTARRWQARRQAAAA